VMRGEEGSEFEACHGFLSGRLLFLIGSAAKLRGGTGQGNRGKCLPSMLPQPSSLRKLRDGNANYSLAPLLRGEGWGEGQLQAKLLRYFPVIDLYPLTRIASQSDLSPQAGRGKVCGDDVECCHQPPMHKGLRKIG
jgi:hypothetical protein